MSITFGQILRYDRTNLPASQASNPGLPDLFCDFAETAVVTPVPLAGDGHRPKDRGRPIELEGIPELSFMIGPGVENVPQAPPSSYKTATFGRVGY